MVVILGLAVPTFWLAQRALCPSVIATEDFVRRRNLWLGITVAAFVCHNYWLFLAVTVFLLVWGASPRREHNPLALFLFVLFAVPAFAAVLPGMGVFQSLFQLTHPRVLELLVLLPAALRLHLRPGTTRMGHYAADWFVLSYLALQVVIYLGAASITQAMRATFYLVIDMVLVYYMASRSVRSEGELRDAAASFCVAMLVVAPIAVFEFGKHWLLYSALSPALGLEWDGGLYLGRDALLRATGPAGHAIALGYAFAVALGLWLCLQNTLRPIVWWAGALALGAGLVAPVSRGPWVGALVTVLLFIASGRHAGPRLAKAAVAAAISVAILAVTPFGAKVIDFLPFIGSVEADTVSYRAQLFQVSLFVISLNPWFGSPSFLSNPMMEQLRQGQGIIDLVNSYIGVALFSGGVGVFLFAGILVSSLWVGWRAARIAAGKWEQAAVLGQSLTAALIGVMVMIATVSSILAIPTIYWSLAGLALAYRTVVMEPESPAPVPTPAPPPASRFSVSRPAGTTAERPADLSRSSIKSGRS